MHDTRVVLKDGRRYVGILWTYRPKEGWFQLAGCADKACPTRFWFRDVVSVVTEGERVGVLRDAEGKVIGPKIEDVDEVARARKDGWDGT